VGDIGEIRLDHIGIAVSNLEEGSKFWRILGLTQHDDDESNAEQGVRIRFFDTEPTNDGRGGTRLELLEPTGPETPVGRFIEKRGVGVQQVAFRVDDLEALLAELKAADIRLIGDETRKGAGGSRIAFVHPSSTGGVLVELVEY
jgi:methylmalonyl-CoA/ethylmalonyl-CoA epimerase